MTTLILNGARRELDVTSVAELVAAEYPSPEGLAVALDGEVVPRSAWDRTSLPQGGRVDILTAVQGG